jgi:hypothetical protein
MSISEKNKCYLYLKSLSSDFLLTTFPVALKLAREMCIVQSEASSLKVFGVFLRLLYLRD